MNDYAHILKEVNDAEFIELDKYVTQGWMEEGMTENDFHTYFNKYLKKKYKISIQMENLYDCRPLDHTKATIISTRKSGYLDRRFHISINEYSSWDIVYRKILIELLNRLK